MDSNGTQAFLRPRARLIGTLGEDLISNEKVALTELVKNAYDADASLVLIRFVPPLEPGRGAIEVWDDGHGMSPEAMRDTWMEIATSHRHRHPKSESGGRRVLGARGIGRFAAARLAHTMTITTRRVDQPEVSVRVNWGDFTRQEAYLDQVPIYWSTSDAPSIFAENGPAGVNLGTVLTMFERPAGTTPGTHGTVLRLEGLNKPWDGDAITDLKQSLSRLLPPPPPAELGVPDQPEFSIYLDTPDGPLDHFRGFISASETLAHPRYRLIGTVRENGDADLSIYADLESETGNRHTQELVADLTTNLRGKAKRPSCGPLKLDIRVWDLESDSLKRLFNLDTGAGNTSQVRKLIRDNSGVALYRDGFRVQPFGESGYDWLGFDALRVNNPTLRLSNNQVAGFVYITADENPGLKDRSHREGLIDNPEFDDLKAVMREAVSRLEVVRYSLRRQAHVKSTAQLAPREPGTGGRGVFESFKLDSLRRVARERYPDDTQLSRAIEKASEQIDEGVRKVQEVISQFSRLATLGTLVDVMLHDGRTSLARIAFGVVELEEIVEQVEESDTELAASLDELRTTFHAEERALDRLFTRIEPLSGRQRGRPKSLALHKSIKEAIAVLEHEISMHHVTVTIAGDDVTVTAEPGDVRTLVLNLVGNAIYWLSTMPETVDRKVLVETARTPDGAVDITVSDSGPGVRDEIKDLIFDTYFSDKPDGIGLGLSIAGSVVKDFYDGDLWLVSSDVLPGASFRARLRRRVG